MNEELQIQESQFLKMLDDFGFFDPKARFMANLERFNKKHGIKRPPIFNVSTKTKQKIAWKRMVEARADNSLVALAITRHRGKDDVSATLFIGGVKHRIRIPAVDIFDMDVESIAKSIFDSMMASSISNPKARIHYEV